jgi:hypothetical protein
LAPRAPGDSVRPRRLSGVVARPLNFTVRRHMAYASVLVTAVLMVAVPASLAAQPAQEAPTPTPAPPVSVIRYTDRPLSEFQTRVMNEATKLSLACRKFRSLYGRWPKDLAEIQAKTEGIDFGVFLGRAVVTPLPDDSERIEIFDGVNTRSVKAVPVELGVTAADREAAKAPGFKIKL